MRGGWRLAAGLVLVGAGAWLADAWAPDRPRAALEARWAPPPSRFVPVLGLEVHVRDEGPRDDPRPVVLIHGTSASLHTWDGWAEPLRPSRRVVRFDLPGFGLTGPFPDDDYAMDHYVAFTRALLDSLGIERCALAGSSFGGNVAWELALADPGRVERLILVDASGYPPAPRSVPLGFRLARSPLLGGVVEHLLPRRVIRRSLEEVYGDPTKVTEALVDRYFELSLRAGNRGALRRRLAHPPTAERAARIRELRVPTLILWGARDRLVPPEHGERFERDIPGSRRVSFDTLGHVPHEEAPSESVRPALEFLADP